MLKFTMAIVLSAACCSAATITYNIDMTIGSGSVMGDIMTDGTTGILSSANIVSWDLVLNDGTQPPFTETTSNAQAVVSPTAALSATETGLFFNFDDGSSYFFIETNSGFTNGVCWSTVPCFTAGDNPGATLIVGGDGGNVQYTNLSGLQAISGTAAPSTPEPATVALLGLGLAALGFRKVRQLTRPH